MHFRRILRTLAPVAAVVVVTLAACEWLVRIVAPQAARIQTAGIFLPDRVAGWRMSPNHSGVQSNRVEYSVSIRTDSFGLRIPVSGPETNRPRKLLLLGDSFAFGQGVEAESTMAVAMERDLEQEGDSVTVLNGAVPGYGTFQETEALRRLAPGLAPGAVIVALFVGNDLQDNLVQPDRRLADGTITAIRKAWYTPVTDWTYAHSHLYALMRGATLAIMQLRQHGRRPEWTEMRDKYGPPDSDFSVEIATMANALDGLRHAASAAHVPVVLALLPEVVQVEPKKQAELRRAIPASIALDYDQPNRAIARVADSLGLPLVDLTPGLRSAAVGGRTFYYPMDRHWTASGNALAGQLLSAELIRRRLLPPLVPNDSTSGARTHRR